MAATITAERCRPWLESLDLPAPLPLAVEYTPVCLLVAASAFILRAFAAWRLNGEHHARVQALRAAHGHYVRHDELTVEASALLERAQAAVHAVSTSRTRVRDLVDSREDDVDPPAALWDLAVGLADYSRLRRELASEEGDSETASALIEQRATMLAQALTGLGSRVCALEHYAAAVERLYAELCGLLRAQRIVAAVDEDLTDLLARTTATEPTIDRIPEMTARVERARRRLTATIADMRDAVPALDRNESTT